MVWVHHGTCAGAQRHQRPQADEAMLRRYEHIVATSSDAMYFVDADCRIVLANPAMTIRFGLTRTGGRPPHGHGVSGWWSLMSSATTWRVRWPVKPCIFSAGCIIRRWAGVC